MIKGLSEKEYQKRYSKVYKKTDKYREYHKEYMQEYNKREYYKKRKNAARSTFHGRFKNWQYGAKDRGISFDITEEYLITLPMTCHYTGRELTLDNRKINTLSLDRIDNSKGYTKENVVLCCHRINQMKNTLTNNDFINLCNDVARVRGKGRI